MTERQLADSFIAFLVAKRGFPEFVLRSEFGVVESKTNETLRLDLVVLDPHRSGFTAVFEFVDAASELDSHEQRNRILRNRAALGKVRRAAYLVAPSESSEAEFLIREVYDEFTFKDIPQNEFPDFQSLLMGETARREAVNDQETEVVVDSFKKWCWSLAGAVALLFILDLVNLIKLTAEQLALLGLATGLALAFYEAKFKFLGIEWERNKEESEKQDKRTR
jgi:hypothetical protein